VEKALKGLLVARGWELRRTHDLRFLVEQAAALGLDLPDDLEVEWLTPWATELRYDEFADDPLERERAVSVATSAVEFAEHAIA
jgi:HEPN domain-containing protein